MGDRREACLEQWQAQEALAEEMIPLLGQLYRQYNVVPLLYGRSLVNQSVIGILKHHRYARRVTGVELTVRETFPLLKRLLELSPGAAHIDLGQLAQGLSESPLREDPMRYLRETLASIVGRHGEDERAAERPRDVVLYGFGRIGRLLARLLIERTGSGSALRLRAVVVRGGAEDLEKRASLLRRDSVHGAFAGTLTLDEENGAIIANGNYIRFLHAESPEAIDYTAYGIEDALVIDNTGRWRDREGLSKHLEARGVARVLLTAPGKGDIRNVVFGINHASLPSDERIVSAASCTTNAIVPILGAIHERYGILHGHVETVHAYTNDQNLIDNYHKGERRGRSAALNMVLTETGAARAAARALPELEGRLTASAIRVPIPDVSMAILHLNLADEVERDALNAHLRELSLSSGLRRQIDYVDSPEVVSSDFIGNRHAGIVDGRATIADGNRIVLYVWYDNEFGYSCQVIRLVQQMAGVRLPSLPGQ
ncbi:glyceraldehyde 3-phosphate dehydrogenase [Kushneria sinocarnis]|uniref:Glyceraldehyde 3-phosphate dehydrogenase n=1 Tax=Kushneria sinocarnis TaxID=595502 RepID=A0A420WYR4_9GAMM|nr:glyceraldehyde-3-phosphate dehydrogenase [Kushneria sinocarnis]RKR06384.1 glyceraldehyde 3-phosphate dehydrogenase [Kushneria sinocarnis]